jgi:hypothetical protein
MIASFREMERERTEISLIPIVALRPIVPSSAQRRIAHVWQIAWHFSELSIPSLTSTIAEPPMDVKRCQKISDNDVILYERVFWAFFGRKTAFLRAGVVRSCGSP